MGYFWDAGNTSLHASPRVRYADLELDSDLNLGNADKQKWKWDYYYGFRMCDLGEPLFGLVSVMRLC